MLEFLTQSTWADRIGWVLVHSLWQFALVALLAAVLQWALQRRAATTRHCALLAVMFVMVAVPVATWFSPWSVDASVAAAKSGQIENYENVAPPQRVAQSQRGNDTVAMTAVPAEMPVELAAKPKPEPQRLPPAPVGLAAWLPEIVLFWLAGVLLAALRPLFSWYTVRRLRTVGVSSVGDMVQKVLERTAKRLRLARAVEVLQSTVVKTPVVVGYFRPAVLLPLCVVTGLPESQLELILAHELAHIRRHDYLVNLLQTLVETLFFYHPAVWWLSSQIRNERENCCDDVAMATVGSRADYGRALLAIEELRATSPALSLAAHGGSLLARIRRIAGCEPAPRLAGGGSILCVILISIAILAAVTWAAAPAEKKLGTKNERSKPTPSPIEQLTADASEPPEVGLPGGVTVELLGVGEKRTGWWKPNGTPFIDGKTPFSTDFGTQWGAEERQMHRAFVLQIKAPFGLDISQFDRTENDQSITISAPLLAVKGLPGMSPHMDRDDRRDALTKEETIRGYVHGSFPANTNETKVVVGLTLAWKTICERDALGRAIGAEAGEVIVVPNPTLPDQVLNRLDMKGDSTFITTAYKADTFKEIRIVAIDQKGKPYLAKNLVSRPGATPPTVTWVFPGPAARVKKFLIQRSPYTWVEFRNVSVQPGHTTHVARVVDGSAVAEANDQPPALLTALGKVVDPAGKPVAGATVFLREWSTYRISSDPYNDSPRDVLATTHTGADGTFRFEKVVAKPFLTDEWFRQNPWDIVVTAKSYGLAWRHMRTPHPSQAFEIKLQPAATISGRVTDHMGRPIKGAEVCVSGIDPLGQELRYDYAAPGTLDLQASQLRPSARTDGEGRFEINGLPREALLTVMVTHDNFDREFLHVATSIEPQPDLPITPRTDAKTAKIHPANFTVKLDPAPPRITGQVLAADTGQPVARARVEGYADSRVTYATADQQGRFVLRYVMGSPCRVRTEGPSGSPYLGRILLVDIPKGKAEVPVDVKLVRGEPLRGMVVAADTGEGVPGVHVAFDTGLDWNHPQNGALLPSHGSTTGSAGHFQLNVPPGKGKLVISGPAPYFDLPRYSGRREDLDPQFAKELDVLHGQAAPGIKFTLQRAGSPIPPGKGVITGRVVDPTGEPVAGAEVAPSFWFRVPGEGQPVPTDRDGRFWLRLTRQLPEEFIIAIDRQRRLRGHAPLPKTALSQQQQTPLEIRLAPTGTITGRVMEDDKPIVGAQIQADELEAVKGDPTASLKVNDRYFAKTDDNGRFDIPMVEAGHRLLLHPYIEGYADAKFGNVTAVASAGQTVEVKPFVMIATNKIVSGVIVDPDGNPVAGVTVSAEMRSGGQIPGAFTHGPTGKDGRFTIRGVPNVPLMLTAYLRPPDDAKDRTIHFSARVEAESGQTDVRIVLDPKLVGRRRVEATPSAVPTPAQILEKLQARRDSVDNLMIEASWEEPSSWEDGSIYRDKQGRIRVRYHFGFGKPESADRNSAKLIDETYNGKFTVNASVDPSRDRLGNPLKSGEIADAANRCRSVMIYNGKWPRDHVEAESHRDPFKDMDTPVIADLSKLLAAGKTVSVEPVKGQPAVYQLGYELDAKDHPNHLKHRVLVDAGKGWVVTRHEQFFPNGSSARLSTCEYRRGEGGWWVPTAGQFRFLWGGTVPTLDWKFRVRRVVVNDPHFDESIFQPELKGFPLRELTESVAGTIVDPDGNPVEGVSVRADLHSGAELLMAFAWEPTGKDGRFAIDGLPNAPIPITAYIPPPPDAKGHRLSFPAEMTAKPGQKDLRIVLDPKLVRGKK